MTGPDLCQRLTTAVLNSSFSFSCELDLQKGLAQLFDELEIPYERERLLAGTDRIDFFLGEGLGLEVKIQESLTSVTRQLHRYAQHPDIVELVLVTTKTAHRRMPEAMCEKPVQVIYLNPF